MNHFIKLPDGTIINVAHVQTIEQDTSNFSDEAIVRIWIEGGDETIQFRDPDGAIYAYFESIAREITQANL